MRRLLVDAKRYLEVDPSEPQKVVWFTPGNTIEYHVKSNSKWIIT